MVMSTLDGQADDESEYVLAVDIGNAYQIFVEDESGNRITDFSDDPLTLVLSYSCEDLSAANVSVGKEGQLAIYRYDEGNDVLCYVGGTVGIDTKSISAEITQPSEYVVVYDSAEPEVTDFIVSDSSATPTIAAYIYDDSDVYGLKVMVDGDVIVILVILRKIMRRGAVDLFIKCESIT